MPVNSAHRVLQRSALGASIAVLGVVSVPAPALATPSASRTSAMTMPRASSTPEHVSEALVALEKNRLPEARAALRRAIHTNAEPTDARMHARESLSALTMGDRAMARMHAANGAAVEHLTYALQALQAGQTDMARGHLTEALALPKVHKYARSAIAAIKHGDRAGARRDISAGLKAANQE
jgi:hypothetical protein